MQQSHAIDCMFHFVEFGELSYVHMLIHHAIDTYSEFQWALSSEKERFWDCTLIIKDGGYLRDSFAD